jgi:hypothetical protein
MAEHPSQHQDLTAMVGVVDHIVSQELDGIVRRAAEATAAGERGFEGLEHRSALCIEGADGSGLRDP